MFYIFNIYIYKNKGTVCHKGYLHEDYFETYNLNNSGSMNPVVNVISETLGYIGYVYDD